jgi:diketogulonate reductase-like aldo/keto reductase
MVNTIIIMTGSKASTLLLLLLASTANALVVPPSGGEREPPQISRRDVLIGSAASLASAGFTACATPLDAANAAENSGTIDMAAINAARAKSPTTSSLAETVDMDKINAARSEAGSPSINKMGGTSIVPITDPPPMLSIRAAGPRSNVKIPRVGYSFYKTAPEQAARCTSLALRAGIRHLDMATSYHSNSEIAKSLKSYLDGGQPGSLLGMKEETAELLQLLDATSLAGEEHTKSTLGGRASGLSPAPLVSAGRRGRREGLFLSHKISNAEQSTDATAVRRSVKAAIATLGCSYLDMVSIHSPLTDPSRRMATYQALLELRDSGFVKTVGVCNYGLGPLQELAAANVELPAVNQLELSPFHAHKDVVDWCDKYGVAVSCGAWSKLSGASGPTEGWDVLAKLAQAKHMTKSQVLVRWALQKGYICVPRSSSASKLERVAIAENSYGGVNLNTLDTSTNGSYTLSQEVMQILDALDVSYKAGKLGRRDGWDDADVVGPDWDPTDYV